MKVLQKKGRSRVKTCRGKLKYVGVPDTHETQPRYKGIQKQNRILNKIQRKRNRKGNTAGYQSPLSFPHLLFVMPVFFVAGARV